jgi:3-methyladenine DNA glycosylase AlkD
MLQQYDFARGIERALSLVANRQKALIAARFFKTAPGQYGEGDIFIGITVPEQRKIARQFRDTPLADIALLLKSKIHEHRFTALEILDMQFARAPHDSRRREVVNFYLKHLPHVNNWDLVDTSAPYILGTWLVDKKSADRKILYKLAHSKNIWERRVAIVSTWILIRNGQYADTLVIAEILLRDSHDLIHKATGWMLREVGKRDQATLMKFLDEHAPDMPRTALRYAIEKFPASVRRKFLAR